MDEENVLKNQIEELVKTVDMLKSQINKQAYVEPRQEQSLANVLDNSLEEKKQNAKEIEEIVKARAYLLDFEKNVDLSEEGKAVLEIGSVYLEKFNDIQKADALKKIELYDRIKKNDGAVLKNLTRTGRAALEGFLGNDWRSVLDYSQDIEMVENFVKIGEEKLLEMKENEELEEKLNKNIKKESSNDIGFHNLDTFFQWYGG